MIAAYRTLLHPLSNYPGPLAAKLTDAYSGFFAYRKSLHLTTWENQQKYGPVVRQDPNKLVFNSIRALRGRSQYPRSSALLAADEPIRYIQK